VVVKNQKLISHLSRFWSKRSLRIFRVKHWPGDGSEWAFINRKAVCSSNIFFL